MSRRSARWAVLCAAMLWGASGVTHAQEGLSVRSFTGAQVRVDGDLRDWRGIRFSKLGQSETGSLEYALGYDAQALYVGARVRDDQFVRSQNPSPAEDALVLTLGMPRASGALQATEVWLYAGIIGQQAAEAALAAPRERPVSSKAVTVAEGPLLDGQGYVLEARVPWSAIGGGSEFWIARGAIRLHDVDKRGAQASELASAPNEPKGSLPPVLLESGPHAALRDFLRAKDLDVNSVRYDLLGDVAGDARLERVALAGTFAVVVGPEVQGGAGFQFVDLPVSSAAAVLKAELRDLTGDDKGELVVRLRQQNDLGTREVLQVLDLAHGQPKWLFAIELNKQTTEGKVAADLDFQTGKSKEPLSLVATIGSAHGLDASNYREAPSRGVEPILLPWGPWARRVYRWDGARFSVVEERENPKAVRATAAPVPKVDATATSAAPQMVYAKPPGTDALIAAFRQAQGIDPALRPRFTQHADVSEDARLESLMLFGKSLLILGKGYRGGAGYFYYDLPVENGDDIQRMWNRDVTGDGRRELFVRHKQRIGDVQREILLCFAFTADGLQPILAVEVRRAQGEASVGNVVELMRERGRLWLRISPGNARGWNQTNYPFIAESQDAYAPLLLPWKDRAVRYHLDGQALVPER